MNRNTSFDINTTEPDKNSEEECNKTCQQIIGIVFVLVGQVGDKET